MIGNYKMNIYYNTMPVIYCASRPDINAIILLFLQKKFKKKQQQIDKKKKSFKKNKATTKNSY